MGSLSRPAQQSSSSRVKSASRLEGNVLEITTQSRSRYLLKIDQMNREMEQTLLEARRQQLYAVAGRTGYEESYTYTSAPRLSRGFLFTIDINVHLLYIIKIGGLFLVRREH